MARALVRIRNPRKVPFCLLALAAVGCVESPPGKDGVEAEFRDSIIVDMRTAWEFNFSHYEKFASAFELSDSERAAYRLSDTSLLHRDTLPNDLFIAAKYPPREWVAYYELKRQIGCDQDSAIPPEWVARFTDASSAALSYFCVDRGLPFDPVRGSSLLLFYDGKGFDIGSFFIWESIPIGTLRIYYR